MVPGTVFFAKRVPNLLWLFAPCGVGKELKPRRRKITRLSPKWYLVPFSCAVSRFWQRGVSFARQ